MKVALTSARVIFTPLILVFNIFMGLMGVEIVLTYRFIFFNKSDPPYTDAMYSLVQIKLQYTCPMIKFGMLQFDLHHL